MFLKYSLLTGPVVWLHFHYMSCNHVIKGPKSVHAYYNVRIWSDHLVWLLFLYVNYSECCEGHCALSLHAIFMPTCTVTWLCNNNCCNDSALACVCINLGRNSVGLTACHLMTNVQMWWHTQVIYHCQRNLQNREAETVLTTLITDRQTQRNYQANGIYQPIVMKNRPSPIARRIKRNVWVSFFL